MMNRVTFRRAEYVINEIYSATSMSEIDEILQEVAEDTGYDKDFLSDLIYEISEDDDSEDAFFEAIDQVVWAAYEQDY